MCSPCAHPVQAFLESPDGRRWCRDASRGAVHALQLAMQLAQARYRRLQRRLRKATWSEYNRMSHVCDKGRRRAKLLRKRAELKRKAEGIDPEMLDMRFEILNKRRDVGYVAGGVWRQELNDKFVDWQPNLNAWHGHEPCHGPHCWQISQMGPAGRCA